VVAEVGAASVDRGDVEGMRMSLAHSPSNCWSSRSRRPASSPARRDASKFSVIFYPENFEKNHRKF